jgi:hypothetical protein
LEKREHFLHRVKDLYFAAGCKVLANEAGILPLTSSESYLAYVGEQTIIDTKDNLLGARLPAKGRNWPPDQGNAITIGGIRKLRRQPDARLPKLKKNVENADAGPPHANQL